MKKDKKTEEAEVKELPVEPVKVEDKISIKECVHNMIANGWNKRNKNQRLIIIIALVIALILNYILLL